MIRLIPTLTVEDAVNIQDIYGYGIYGTNILPGVYNIYTEMDKNGQIVAVELRHTEKSIDGLSYDNDSPRYKNIKGGYIVLSKKGLNTGEIHRLLHNINTSQVQFDVDELLLKIDGASENWKIYTSKLPDTNTVVALRLEGDYDSEYVNFHR